MSARTLPATGQAAVEDELLAQLGLPPSARPTRSTNPRGRDEYLAAAPSSIRAWAHDQSAALDAAYLQLTDHGRLRGLSPQEPDEAAEGRTRGPATPPARRVSLPVAPPDRRRRRGHRRRRSRSTTTTSRRCTRAVTPSAHEDMGPDRGRAKHRRPASPRRPRSPPPPRQPASDAWKKLAVGVLGIGQGRASAFAATPRCAVPRPAATGTTPPRSRPPPPVIDEAKVTDLMTKLQANPADTADLLALADEFYAGGHTTRRPPG